MYQLIHVPGATLPWRFCRDGKPLIYARWRRQAVQSALWHLRHEV